MATPELNPDEGIKAVSVTLERYVDAGDVPDDAFGRRTAALRGPNDGEALVETIYLSVDPYMRPLMRLNKAHYAPSFALGEPISGGAIARVLASRADGFAPGDVITGRFPWATHALLSAGDLKAARRIPKELLGAAPLPRFLGALGMPGLTAYASLRKIAEPIKKGEVAFVSGAAGAVGQVAGQMLKNVYGCRVVGSAGSDEKVALLRELGFDAAWNYKRTLDREALAQHCPDGIDIYFDNVGGATLEAALDAANTGARVVACGQISQYALAPEERYGVKNLFNVVGKQIKMQGFIVSTLADAATSADFSRDMAAWTRDGAVKASETVYKGGVGALPAAFRSMLSGGNVGKAVVAVGADPYPAAA